MKPSRKRRKVASVLNRQKPQRGRARNLPPWLQRLRRGALVLAALALVAAGMLAKRRYDAIVAATPEGTAWNVTIKVADDTPLVDKQRDEIVKTARRLLGKGTKQELARAAAAIQQLDAYADVHVIRLSAASVAVQVHQRTPLFCIEADRLRFVAASGEVYGQAERERCQSLIVTGLFEPGTRFTLRPDMTVALEAEDRTLVREAIDLSQQTRSKGLALASMSVLRYRGFSIVLAGPGTEVAMGRAPFAPKLEKLEGILQKLAAKQQLAARIELDYQGKAFIKLKKM
jgi:hypothetical protein